MWKIKKNCFFVSEILVVIVVISHNLDFGGSLIESNNEQRSMTDSFFKLIDRTYFETSVNHST